MNTNTVNLQALIDLVGNDPLVIRDVLESFRTSAANSRDQMEQGARTGQVQAVSVAAHRLKSGARSIGAQRLGQICEEIEAASEHGELEALTVLLALFQVELSAVLRFLESQ